MKKSLKRLLPLLLALLLVACGGTAEIGDLDRDVAVVDNANVLSVDTENYVTNLSVALQEACGAQIGVYTVEYIGNTTMEAYAYDVANSWGLGDKDKDNGIVLLLAVGEDDYWVMRGAGLESQLSEATLSSLLYEQLEPSWLLEDYNTGTRKTVRELARRLCGIYGLTMDLDAVAGAQTSQNDGNGQPVLPVQSRVFDFTSILLIVIAVILVIVLLNSFRRPRNGPPPPANYGYGGYTPRRSSFGSGFANGVGFGIGQSVGRSLFGGARRRTPSPPPPRPGGYTAPRPNPPRPSTPRPGGGFSAPRSGGFSAPRSGGFGGAGRVGGSIGRSGGSFRAGGGSFRGGGAGRRK